MTDPMPPSLFPHGEAQLAERFGVSRAYLRNIRGRKSALDHRWRLQNGAVRWSEAAVEALAASLGVENGAVASDDPPAIKTRAVPLIVAQARLSNTRLLACVAAGEDPLDRERWRLVRVRDSARFVRGMEILAETIENSAMWRFLGRPDQPDGTPVRYPRGKGKW
jgi:hypothetical protein